MFSWLYQSNYNTPVCHSYSCNYEKCERKFNIINDMKICKNVVTKESCYNIQRSMLDSCKLSTKTSPMSHVIVSTFGGCPFLLNKKDSLKCSNEKRCYNIQRSVLDSCKLSTKTSPMSHVIVSTLGGCPFLLNKKDSLKCCNERKMLQNSKKKVRFIQNSRYIDC